MKVEHKVIAVFLVALLAVSLVCSVGYFDARDFIESEHGATQTQRVIAQLNALLADVQDLTIRTQAFTLSGQTASFDALRASLDQIAAETKALRQAVAGDNAQQKRLDRLEILVQRLVSSAQTRIAARQSGDAVSPPEVADAQPLEEIRSLTDLMEQAEERSLQDRSRLARQSARQALWTLTLPPIMAVLLLLAFYLFIRFDLAARRRADKALRVSEKKFRAVLESAPDPILISDAAGRIQLVNSQAERLFGYGRDEFAERPFDSLLARRAEPAAPPEETPAAREMRVLAASFDGVRKNGERFPLELTQSPLEVGGELLLISAIRDRTTQQRAEDALQKHSIDLARSNAELERFAYVASHDLQEPLRMVSSYTQLLAKRYRNKLDADADEFIAYAVDGANRMQKLINDLLSLSRVGTQAKANEPVDCQALLARVISDLRPTLEASGAEVICAETLPSVLGDKSQLGQLFQNLIGNAVKFRGPQPPRVEIGAARMQNGWWRFSCKDNGIGLEPQYADRIFIIFQRLHGKEAYPGTGIGLAICKKIVERHGGKLWVESQVNEGANFFFTLPPVPV